MTTTPSDPNLQPDDLPDGDPSRPHGDPVLPDPGENPGAPDEPGSPGEPQTFPQTDPEAPSDPNAQPGQMPESSSPDVGA